MQSHGGGDVVEMSFSSVPPQGGQVHNGPPKPSTKSGAPKSTRFAEPVASSNCADDGDYGVSPKKQSSLSYGRSAILSAPSRAIKQVPRELRRLTTFHRRGGGRVSGPHALDRSTTAAARALDGLRFVGGGAAAGWDKVEENFDALTKHQGGVLYRSQFGQCIGMNKMEKVDDAGKGKTMDEKGHRDGQGRGFCCFFGDTKEMGSANNDDEKQPSPAAAAARKKPADKLDFAGELFDALNRRRAQPGDGITKDEMLEFWEQINNTSFDSRLQTFFDMVDKNADGRISEEEIKEIITLSASENKLSQIREHAEEYARLIMEEMDPDNLGSIELHDLERVLLRQSPSQPSQRRRSSLSRLRSKAVPETSSEPSNNDLLLRWLRHGAYLVEDNWRRAWVMLLWLSICAALFAWKFVQYRRRHDVFRVMGYCVCVAKGAAETLKFNMALVLLPVCRNTVTWILDHTAAGRVVPLAADSLNFHKVVAAGIAVGAGLHILSHLTCDFPRLLRASDEAYEPMKPFFGETRPDSYWWFVKGTEGWTGLVMLALMAVAFTLATPWFRRGLLRRRLPWPLRRMVGFNAFWYAHHCFVAVYALLLVHGHYLYLTREWYKKSTWMYLAAPVAVYAGERLTRALRSRVRPAKVLGADVYPGDVLSLRFATEPPHGFRYKSGQYIFLNCAAVSPFEWHPFSITSAPQDDYVSVHIRDAGDWTHKLMEIFLEAKNEGQSGMTNPNWPKVRIDGPYGAPAQDYKQYDVVLLVGSGIGATPMISIIKDILNNMKQLEGGDIEAGSCSGAVPSSSFRTRRAYFYWVTREQDTFEWFHKVMDEVVEADKDGIIELHNHCTSVYEEGDARSVLISMLQSINEAKTGVDVVSGNRARTHFARPDWRQVYSRIAHNHRDQRVGVFYCGTKVLTTELRQLAQEFSRNSSTNCKFEFHKEIF